MKREDLKKLELTDEAIDQIMAMNGKDIEAHKAKVTQTEQERDAAREQLKDANKQIESFKGMDIEGIKKGADEWKAKAEKAETDAKAEVERLKFDYALESALTGAKAKNPKAVKALLKADALKLNDDGSILGLKEQLETVKSENDYLFESDEKPPKITTGAGPNQPATGSYTLEQIKKMSTAEINKNWEAVQEALAKGK